MIIITAHLDCRCRFLQAKMGVLRKPVTLPSVARGSFYKKNWPSLQPMIVVISDLVSLLEHQCSLASRSGQKSC